MKELTYIQFPLFLMRDIYVDRKKALNSILCVGLYNHSLKIEPNLNSVAKQLMYCYYRKKKDLSSELINSIDSCVENGMLILDEEYCGFNDLEFNPSNEIVQLLNIFEEDSYFESIAVDFYTIRETLRLFNIDGDYLSVLETGKKIYDSMQPKEPMPMININQLLEFRDEDKGEVDLMTFTFNIGIRSIIGSKSYVKTNKDHILCRAFGYSSVKDIPAEKRQLFVKYEIRHHRDKILNLLKIGNWNLLFYSTKMRGMYIAFKDKIELKELISIAEKQKPKNKLALLNSHASKVRHEVLQSLKIA